MKKTVCDNPEGREESREEGRQVPSLNADMGERGVDSDEDHRLMPLLDIANLACGGHAGSRASVDFYKTMAAEEGVEVAAHLSYADKASFGRKVLDVSIDQLKQDLDQQRTLLPDTRLLKFHGALYNQVCVDPILAEAMVEWVVSAGFDRVLTLPHSLFALKLHERGLRVICEAFIDRRYLFKGEGRAVLMPRTHATACMDDLSDALEQVDQMLSFGRVIAYSDHTLVDRKRVQMPIGTLCIHSDSMLAYPLAHAVRALLGAKASK